MEYTNPIRHRMITILISAGSITIDVFINDSANVIITNKSNIEYIEYIDMIIGNPPVI